MAAEMAMKRVYTFRVDAGIGLKVVKRQESRDYDANLTEIGITNWELALLYAIGAVGGGTASEIGRELGMDRATVKRHLAPLAESSVAASASPPGQGCRLHFDTRWVSAAPGRLGDLGRSCPR